MTGPRRVRCDALLKDWQEAAAEYSRYPELDCEERSRVRMVPLFVAILWPLMWAFYQDAFEDGRNTPKQEP